MSSAFLRRVLVQAAREWQEFHRDRLSLTLAFLLPVLTLCLIGYGLRLELKNISAAIEDRDNTFASRMVSEKLFATNMFIPVAAATVQNGEETLRSGEAQVAIVIEKGFQKQLDLGERASIKALVDGTDINSALAITSVINSSASNLFSSPRQSVMGDRSRIVPVARTWFNPGRKESLYVITGAYAVILWIFPPILAALAAAREVEQETILRVYTSSLSGWEFLLGKGFVYYLIGLMQALGIFALGSMFFGLKVEGNPILLAIATSLYLLCSVMFGFIPGFRARSQTAAMQLVSTTGFFPALLLSGFVYPISNIPEPLNIFPYFVPAKYFVDVSRDTFIRGSGWEGAGIAVIVLFIFACVLTFVAWQGIRKMQLRAV